MCCYDARVCPASCIAWCGISALTSLNLSDNFFGPDGAKALAPALAANSSLTKISVGNSRLGAEGEEELRKAVEGRSGFELML